MAKSKLPDFDEVTKFAGKLFKDLKQSVTEICTDYKKAREGQEEDKQDAPQAKETEAPKAKSAKPKSEAKKNEDQPSE